MKKTIYIVLAGIATLLLVYTGYYAITHQEVPQITLAATSTEVMAVTTPPVDTNTHTTPNGKKITLIETNPLGESASTITLTTSGFATNSPIILETSKLIDSFYADLNDDSFEELIIITQAQGSRSYGEAIIYTSASNTALLPVRIQQITENDTKKESLFEGYLGHDSFSLINKVLSRSFPTYKKNDSNDNPTGPTKTVLYSLSMKNGEYSATFVRGTTTQSSIQPEQKTQISTSTNKGAQ